MLSTYFYHTEPAQVCCTASIKDRVTSKRQQLRWVVSVEAGRRASGSGKAVPGTDRGGKLRPSLFPAATLNDELQVLTCNRLKRLQLPQTNLASPASVSQQIFQASAVGKGDEEEGEEAGGGFSAR